MRARGKGAGVGSGSRRRREGDWRDLRRWRGGARKRRRLEEVGVRRVGFWIGGEEGEERRSVER